MTRHNTRHLYGFCIMCGKALEVPEWSTDTGNLCRGCKTNTLDAPTEADNK